jgi:hypothetical protein
MNLFDFLATQSGSELLRIIGNVVSIVGAVLTGAALRNISQLKKMIGGVVKPTVLSRIFRRARHGSDAVADAQPDAFQSMTLAQKVDNLKDNQELLWLRSQVPPRVDPPNRRH